jgi:hypothetical protein
LSKSVFEGLARNKLMINMYNKTCLNAYFEHQLGGRKLDLDEIVGRFSRVSCNRARHQENIEGSVGLVNASSSKVGIKGGLEVVSSPKVE